MGRARSNGLHREQRDRGDGGQADGDSAGLARKCGAGLYVRTNGRQIEDQRWYTYSHDLNSIFHVGTTLTLVGHFFRVLAPVPPR